MMDAGQAKFLKGLLAQPSYKRAVEIAKEQLAKEAVNAAMSTAPISDPRSVERLLQTQGWIQGVSRFLEILEDIGVLDGGRDPDDDDPYSG